MTDIELEDLRKAWQLDARQLARVLCVHSNKLSEYLAGVTRIPCSIAMHLEALSLLTHAQRVALIDQRLKRNIHG